jgi:hypothetical protein
VYRAVFRACFFRFRECSEVTLTGSVSLETNRGPQGRVTFSRKREEFMADFCLVSRRTLDEDEHKLFRFHFLLGADWRLCCTRMCLDRGEFFHAVYRIQQRLGHAFADLEPYALYPLREYFNGVVHNTADSEVHDDDEVVERRWQLSA